MTARLDFPTFSRLSKLIDHPSGKKSFSRDVENPKLDDPGTSLPYGFMSEISV